MITLMALLVYISHLMPRFEIFQNSYTQQKAKWMIHGHVTFATKELLKIMQYAAMFATSGHIFPVINITRYTYSKLQMEEAPWYCKKCIKNTIPYWKLSITQLEELMTGKLLTSLKLTIEKNNIFPSDDCENVIKNELYTPENLYKINLYQ